MAYLHALDHAGLAAATASGADLMQRTLGPAGAQMIAWGIAVSTFGYCNITILGGARVFQVMGADGAFFRAAARIDPRFPTPHAALFDLASWAAALALSGSYGQLLDYATVGDWIGSAMVAATLFFYRRREPDAPFRLPGHPWLPLAFIAAVAAVVTSSAWSNPRNALIGLAIIAAGVPVYFVWRWRAP